MIEQVTRIEKVIMEDKVYKKLIQAIKKKDASKFIKTLVDFYDSDERIEMPSLINLSDYLRCDVNDVDKMIHRQNANYIYLHKSNDEVFDMTWFIRDNSEGYYKYKGKLYWLYNYESWCGYGDGYYVDTPYLKTVITLDDIVEIGEE